MFCVTKKKQQQKPLFVSRVKEGPLSVPGLYFMYNVWQDAGIRTQVATTAARCATNELHTSHQKLATKTKLNWIRIRIRSESKWFRSDTMGFYNS